MSPARPRRVVLIELNRDGTVGGSFQCLHDIARCLDRSRFQPVAVFWHANRFAERLSAQGVEVHLWERQLPDEGGSGRRHPLAKASRLVNAIARRHRFLRSVRADLVHLNNSPEVGYDDWLPAARLHGVPIVAHARADASGTLGPVARRLAGSYDRVIAISRHVAGTLLEAGIPDRRIAQIYDGIDIEALQGAARRPANATRRELGVPDDGFLVLMAGNLKRWKGQHVLLEALSLAPAELRQRCYVAFAGAAPADTPAYEAELRARVSQDGFSERVRFLGSRSDVPALMSAADVVVHASIRPEPFGLVVIEAMALGRPIVASRLGGPAETVTPGSGLLFDPAHPDELAGLLLRVLHDAPLRLALSIHGPVRAEEFSIRRNVGALEAVYGEILRLPSPTPVPA